MKPDKNRARGIGFYLLIGVIILAVIFYLTTPAEQKEYTYSEIEELFRQEQVKSFCLEGDELTLNLYSPDSDGNTTIKKTLPSPTWFREDLGDLIEQQTASGVLTEFDRVIGLSRLKAVHINDSMNPVGAHKDRHARIGEGYLGEAAFGRIVNHPALRELPFILETPNDLAGYAREIARLRELRME